MFLIDQLDSAVHYLATQVGKPDGNLCRLIRIRYRSDETDALHVCCLPLRLDNERLRQRNPCTSFICNRVWCHSADIYVQRANLSSFHIDHVHLYSDGVFPQNEVTQLCLGIQLTVSEWIAYLQNDYKLRRLGYGYHHVDHASSGQTLFLRILLQGRSTERRLIAQGVG